MSHPPGKGEFRIVNQLTEVKSIKEVAKAVSQVTGCDIHSIENPRAEREKHEYHPTHEKLKKWGLTDPILMVDEIRQMVQDVKKHKDRIREEVIMPRTRWNDGPE
jgi:UDP-sulfoquinovose synthase